MPEMISEAVTGVAIEDEFVAGQRDTEPVVEDDGAPVWSKLPYHTGRYSLDQPVDDSTRNKAVSASERMFYSSGLASRLMGLTVDFIIGDGMELAAKDDGADKVLKDFWSHPVNTLSKDIRSHVRDLVVYGELLYCVKVNDDGFVGLTQVPTSMISDVSLAEENVGSHRHIDLENGNDYEEIHWDSSLGGYKGDAFYLPAINLGGQVRGFPMFIALLDWLRASELYFYNHLEKRAHFDSIWWEVTLEGFSDSQAKEWLRSAQAAPPKPGSVVAHNEKVEWNLKTPDFRSSNLGNDGQFITNFILSNAGLDQYYFGSREARGGAGEAANPVVRSLESRQWEVKEFYRSIGNYVLQEAKAANKIPDRDYEVLVDMATLSIRDFQRSSGALQRFVQSLETAQERGWIDKEKAVELFNGALMAFNLLSENVTDHFGINDEEDADGGLQRYMEDRGDTPSDWQE